MALQFSLRTGFAEALAAARARGVELPDSYYTRLPEEARSRAFTVSGLARIAQIESVRDTLNKALAEGTDFADWKKQALTDPDMARLPTGRLDTIWRNAVQTAYQAGHWEQAQANIQRRPFILYDAIDDPRTRPEHAALDGFIAPVEDPVWQTHYPPNGNRCRCNTITLTQRQAEARGWTGTTPPVPGQPDPGWAHNPATADGLRAAVTAQAAATPPVGAVATASAALLERLLQTLTPASAAARARTWLGERYAPYAQHAQAGMRASRLDEAHAVAVVAYTDKEVSNALNRTARWMAGMGEPPTDWMAIVALMVLLDEALEQLPPQPGYYWRGSDIATLPAGLAERWRDAHREGRVTQYSAYTSVMNVEGLQYGGDWQMQLFLLQARDIALFSLEGEPESLLPRNTQLRAEGFRSGYRDFVEVEGEQVKKNRRFSTPEDQAERELRTARYMAEHGYGSVEYALQVQRGFATAGEAHRQRQAELWAKATEGDIRRARNMFIRMQLTHMTLEEAEASAQALDM